MKNLTVITLLLLLLAGFVKAQNPVMSNPQPDSLIKVIPIGEGRHSSYLYTIGGKLQTREDVAGRLIAYSPSAAEYRLALNNVTWGYISTGGFAASGLAAVLEFVHDNKYAGETTGFINGQPGFIYQHHNLAGAYVFTGLATAFLVSAFIHLERVSFHSKRAMKLYNRRFE